MDARGPLSGAAAKEKLASFGRNETEEGEKRSFLRVSGTQFTDVTIMLLIAAAAISGLVGEPQDTISILVIVVLNAVIGSVQEYRVEKAVAAISEVFPEDADDLGRAGCLQVA